MHAVKKDAYISLLLVAVFVSCCLIMLTWGHDMNNALIVIPFIGIWGLSALLAPAFALRSLRRYFRR